MHLKAFAKKSTRSATLAAAVTLVAGSLLTGAANLWAATPITVKFAHVVAENTPKGKAALRFQELVHERLGDRVKVEVYPNSQLFGDDKVLEAMLLGDVQIAAPSLSKFQKYTKQLQIFDLPFLFQDMAAVDRFQQGPVGQKLLTSLERKGLMGLGYIHNGMKHLSAYDPIRVPADAAGKKFRIQTSDVLAAQFEAVDAVPLKKPFSEVFTLLQTRAIDGTENPWTNIYSKKFFEVQPYITETNHGLLDYMVVTSARFWKKLPDDVRAEMKQAMDEAIAYGNQVAHEQEEKDRQLIIDSGVTQVIGISAEERALWVQAMQPVWKEFEKEIGADVIQAALDANNP